MKNITISDVAEALGVSKTTVSRAISGKGRIGAETREKVLAYIEKHNYTPNVIAKSLAQSKTYNIGVMIPAEYDITDLPFFQSCLFGIQEIAATMDYDILLTISKPEDTSHLERIVTNRKVDGVILMRTFVDDKQAKVLAKRGLPFVTIGSTNVEQAIQVDQDHKNACKELTSILLMKKMTRIALIGGDENHVVTQNRLRGYIEAFEDAGIPVIEDLIYLGANNQVLLEQRVEDILQKGADCIISMDDALCGNVLKKLRAEHVKVPGDIKIASFYNSSLLENNVPSITSLSFDEKELGMVACRNLMDKIEDKETHKTTTLGYQVILRESTQ
ncbi:MAG: LacI family DNA-binding transcriptional regulator [Lachnospiraceae bacterium]|nr:LacI family DNA-binding transcriptional regulator [Lachnospiraceae bacterium]